MKMNEDTRYIQCVIFTKLLGLYKRFVGDK